MHPESPPPDRCTRPPPPNLPYPMAQQTPHPPDCHPGAHPHATATTEVVKAFASLQHQTEEEEGKEGEEEFLAGAGTDRTGSQMAFIKLKRVKDLTFSTNNMRALHSLPAVAFLTLLLCLPSPGHG
ncbi:hypothetical protein F2P81_006465, partial [Scophthalmus maximus]